MRRHLERVLASGSLSSSPRLSQFLRYVVEKSLTGATDELKEYTVGVEVFDRGDSFDPRTDTIVRVQARRLRLKLEEYYRAEGRSEPVRIEVPKGGYTPYFRWIADPTSESARVASAERYGLPIPRTSLVGREVELEALEGLLRAPDTRLATVTGVGGSGKTRLAVETGWRISADFPGGVFFAPLAAAEDLDVARAIVARTLGLSLGSQLRIDEALFKHLKSSVNVPTLLLLDNLEHLEGAPTLVSGLIDACPSLRILATSRAVLRIYGEHEFLLPPLQAPTEHDLQSLDALAKNPAVQLLVERGKAVNRTLGLTRQNAAAIGEICRRLDGLPLAIELAAAHCKTLRPAALLSRLKTPLDFLADGPRDVPKRQQTLRATLDWSYSLLTESEQRLFRRLSVLPAACTLESAEVVADASCDLGAAVHPGLHALVDKNLMYCTEPLEEEPRFAMLQTVREYGLEKLSEAGEGDTVLSALAAYTIVLAEEIPTDDPETQDAAWMARCEAEYPNMVAAVDWLIAQKNAEWASRACLGLFRYWERRYFFTDGRKYFEALLKLPDLKPEARALATSSKASLICLQGDIQNGLRMYDEGLELFREMGDVRGIAREANGLAVAHRRQGDLVRAQGFFEEALQACRDLGDEAQIASILSNLADVAGQSGNSKRAGELIEQALGIFRKVEYLPGVAWSLNQMGDHARRENDFETAKTRYDQALEVFQQVGHRMGVGRCLQDLAELACAQSDFLAAKPMFECALDHFVAMKHDRGIGMLLDRLAGVQATLRQPAAALTLAGAASSSRESAGATERPWSPAEHALREQTLDSAQAQLDEVAAEEAWEQGRTMGLSAALDYARALDWTVHDGQGRTSVRKFSAGS